jgi:hypothetical protein
LALDLRKLLDRVTQHRARHVRRMRVQKRVELGFFSFSYLSQHPTDRLIHQILAIIAQFGSKAKKSSTSWFLIR